MADLLGLGTIADAAARVYVKTVELVLEVRKPKRLTAHEVQRVTNAKDAVGLALQTRVQGIPRGSPWRGGYDLKMDDLDVIIAENRGAILQIPGGKGALAAYERAAKSCRNLESKLTVLERKGREPGPKTELRYPEMAARRARRQLQSAADRIASLTRYEGPHV